LLTRSARRATSPLRKGHGHCPKGGKGAILSEGQKGNSVAIWKKITRFKTLRGLLSKFLGKVTRHFFGVFWGETLPGAHRGRDPGGRFVARHAADKDAMEKTREEEKRRNEKKKKKRRNWHARSPYSRRAMKAAFKKRKRFTLLMRSEKGKRCRQKAKKRRGGKNFAQAK